MGEVVFHDESEWFCVWMWRDSPAWHRGANVWEALVQVAQQEAEGGCLFPNSQT